MYGGLLLSVAASAIPEGMNKFFLFLHAIKEFHFLTGPWDHITPLIQSKGNAVAVR